jgi:anti-sigma B factor antagonist
MTQPSRPSNVRVNSELVPSTRYQGDAALVTVRGEIDLHNSPELRTALLNMLNERQPKKLILNLGQVPYMDSSAIAVLVEALQKLRKTGGKIYLTQLQPRVKGLLEIARLDSIFAIVASDEDALKK